MNTSSGNDDLYHARMRQLSEDFKNQSISAEVFLNESVLVKMESRYPDYPIKQMTVDQAMLMEMSLPYPMNQEWAEAAEALQERFNYDYRAF